MKFRLAIAALAFIGVRAAPAPNPQVEAPADPEPAAVGTSWRDMTGCTCLGWPFQGPIFFSQAAGKKQGWCWKDGDMIQRDVNLITNAVLNNRRNSVVDGREANIWCRARGTRMRTQPCVDRVILEFTRTQGPGLLSLCRYPRPGTFTPTTCDCGFTCIAGHIRCGRWCVPRGTQCNGGVPIERICEPGFKLCNGICVLDRGIPCPPTLPGQPRDAELDERDADIEIEDRDLSDEELDARDNGESLETRDADANANADANLEERDSEDLDTRDNHKSKPKPEPKSRPRCRPGWVWCSTRCWLHSCPKPQPQCKKGWYWCRSRCVPSHYKCPREAHATELLSERDFDEIEGRDFEAEERDYYDILARGIDETELDGRDMLMDLTERDANADAEAEVEERDNHKSESKPSPKPSPRPRCRPGWVWCSTRCWPRSCPRPRPVRKKGWVWCHTRCVPFHFKCPRDVEELPERDNNVEGRDFEAETLTDRDFQDDFEARDLDERDFEEDEELDSRGLDLHLEERDADLDLDLDLEERDADADPEAADDVTPAHIPPYPTPIPLPTPQPTPIPLPTPQRPRCRPGWVWCATGRTGRTGRCWPRRCPAPLPPPRPVCWAGWY